MNPYISNCALNEAADLLRQTVGPVVVLTHAKPDGDAAGSLVALVTALNTMGKQARGVLVPPITPSLSFLTQQPSIDIWDDNQATASPADTSSIAHAIAQAERLVIVDTGAYVQLGPLAELMKPRLDRAIIFDHHLSGDIEATARYIDPAAAAAAEIIADLIDQLIPEGLGLPPQAQQLIRDALFTGIASDTGWFRFSNVTPQTHRLAGALLEAGVDHAGLYARLEQAERPAKLKLLSRAVESLKLLADDQVAVMALRQEDFAQSGARPDETERLIDLPQQVASVRVVALLTQADDERGPQTRVSFRSKPGPGAIDVAALAGQFGGGGHARAAGAKIAMPLPEVQAQVAEALCRALAKPCNL